MLVCCVAILAVLVVVAGIGVAVVSQRQRQDKRNGANFKAVKAEV